MNFPILPLLAACDFRALLHICCRALLLMAGVLLIVIAADSNRHAKAQGLLGKRYVEGGFQMETFDDGFAEDWIYGTSIATNLPLTETWDFYADATIGWLNTNAVNGTTPERYDFDSTILSAGIRKHFRPEATLDPFGGIGLRYAKVTQFWFTPSQAFYRNDTLTRVDWSAGVEWKLTERSAIRPQVLGGDTLEDFDLGDAVSENLYFECPAIYWWNENWFTTLTITTDFDDSEYGFRFTVGFGEW